VLRSLHQRQHGSAQLQQGLHGQVPQGAAQAETGGQADGPRRAALVAGWLAQRQPARCSRRGVLSCRLSCGVGGEGQGRAGQGREERGGEGRAGEGNAGQGRGTGSEEKDGHGDEEDEDWSRRRTLLTPLPLLPLLLLLLLPLLLLRPPPLMPLLPHWDDETLGSATVLGARRGKSERASARPPTAAAAPRSLHQRQHGSAQLQQGLHGQGGAEGGAGGPGRRPPRARAVRCWSWCWRSGSPRAAAGAASCPVGCPAEWAGQGRAVEGRGGERGEGRGERGEGRGTGSERHEEEEGLVQETYPADAAAAAAAAAVVAAAVAAAAAAAADAAAAPETLGSATGEDTTRSKRPEAGDVPCG
jgi:hypothetical protein